LAPNQANDITQSIRLNGVERGKGSTVKMRWKTSYVVGGSSAGGAGGERREEQGEIANLGVP